MKKFMLLYTGINKTPAKLTKEQGQVSDQVHESWVESIGDALVDIGSAMTKGTSIVDDGSITNASNISGYSVIQADTMYEAIKLVDGNPFLMYKTGDFKIEIFELI